MVDVIQELEHLNKLAKEEPEKRFNRLYRLLYQPELLMIAKTKVERNKGANTPGVDGKTMDEMVPKELEKLNQELKSGTYRPQPVRRTYIPKKNGQRPLGIPTSRDKIVQAGIALILEALYEPIFSQSSHGFRPGRSPITALRKVSTAYKAGATWIIEGDLEKCFDSIPHGVILNCLRKRIRDERFIDLIRKIIKAGVMEQGRHQRTYSGVPQGGVASPILTNVVLHELDMWLETQIRANPPAQTTAELNARKNPEYMRLSSRITDLRRYLDGKRPIPKGKDRPLLRQELREKMAARRQLPCYLPRRVIYYTRFADDFLIVLCHSSKNEARQLKQQLSGWLKTQLGLHLNADKTLITHWTDSLRFLGYQLQGRRDARGTPWLHLSVPPEAVQSLVTRIKQATKYPQAPEFDVFQNVNALVRGWTNYYRFAHTSNKVAGRIITIVFWRSLHYLGQKHRRSLRKMMRRRYVRNPKTGCMTLFVQRPGAKSTGDPRYYLWHKRPKRLSLMSSALPTISDKQPYLNTNWGSGHSQSDRLEALAQADHSCQSCRRNDLPLVLHHPNRLRNVKRVQKGYGHVARSGADQPGKVLCHPCHLVHHHGHTRQ
jgi:group II intron reverse transcriptase/maturase